MKRRVTHAALSAVLVFSFLSVPLSAEEGFGFDTADGAVSESAAETSVTVGGEVSAGASLFMEELAGISRAAGIRAGNLVSGKLGFAAKGSNADAVIDLKLKPVDEGSSPLTIDEAYLRGYFGKLDVEAGLRKLSWGKADSIGPLDVTNPLDLTDLTVTDSLERKIARPMVHATLGLGQFTRLEAVVIPSFEGHRFATEGRWAPARVTELPAAVVSAAPLSMQADILSQFQDMKSWYPVTDTIEYTQAGIRLTTTVGSSDFGFQYYFGNLPRPGVSLLIIPTGITTATVAADISYNRYHQVGADYAAVVAGFNVRLEAAANITEDLSGDDGAVYNPALLWSAGFDRDVIAGINVNLQGAGSVRLMDDKVSGTIADTEAGTDMTQTRITVQLSRKIFRDALELKASGIYDIGYTDWIFVPALVWTKGDVEAEAAAGFFGGDADGELGQYDANDYLKLMVTYRF